MLPTAPAVRSVVLDFERATWVATRKVLPTVSIRGCAFHWGQAVWRKCQRLGLQVAYSKQDNVHRFIRQLMALPYLPKEHIPAAFQKLKSRIQPNNRMYRLLTYIQRRWIDSTIFPISAWTVFGQPIRTNNDVEGWHNRLNRKAKGASLHLYVMLKVLSDEARYLPMQIQLVSEHKLTRYQRAATKRSQSKLMELWDSYRSQQLTVSQLMSSVALIVVPSID
ncbi:uncharacterized protein [Mytilus edulis]|uniref:uncharacterized protein n=1 Tax=Mytilus edulis TaxID=6550 RepID=UPI0039F07E3F